MNLSMEILIQVLKIIALVSILFVWVVRYNNIQNEFEKYNLPNWLRDMVGIIKISFAVMLHSDIITMILIGSGGISLLMSAAIFTHFRVKNELYKMLPALSLLSIGLVIFMYTL